PSGRTRRGVAVADVIVVDVGGRKLAVPTVHAREVAAAGWVTPVPLALPPIAGVTQLRGQIVPVLDVGAPPRAVQPEDPLLVLEYGTLRAALVFSRLCPPDEVPADAELLDVAALFDKARR
ncbi:MAG: chemotaxis protein CheW, partial [Polyangia bacterium]